MRYMYHGELIVSIIRIVAASRYALCMASTTLEGRESGGSQTLERGIRLLGLLAARPQGLNVTAISTEMGTHRAGIYRLLRPLEAARLVERKGNGTYVLGVGIVSLAASVRSGLQEVAGRELQRLADALSCTCALTLRDGEEAVVALVQEPVVARMHIAYQRGLRHPLSQAASGLAILAAGEPRAGERAEVRRARRAGFAVTRGELFSGATGVAVPLFLADEGGVASISAVWLGEEVDQAQAVAGLQECAAVIAAALTDESSGTQ